jgi:putative addiction module component (TIGR02574 family)
MNRECAVGDIGALRARPLLARDARERIKPMQSSPLAQLLKLPASDRAELAVALWESLTDGEREEELALTDAQRAELDRRWAEHVKNPDSAVPWSDVRRKLLG